MRVRRVAALESDHGVRKARRPLVPDAHVEETLTFTVEFRFLRTLPESKKRARVQALIDQLGLLNSTNTIVGDEDHRRVSSREKRRVLIGVDVIQDSILLFLDESLSKC
ncbi:P-loop containing nucleoside triphosphate hydrolase [Trema orientale]|uniref:P-loop containing nucleoside triphosphate hydrolase n=1 Tax=Trema orientale TaxID=63057 RepID=A0A2P5FPW7_TREOI|nr:P-loop containing nucleoside triphosphate hydrolase [Trema orientale]